MHVHPCNVCYQEQRARERIADSVNFHKGPTYSGPVPSWFDPTLGDRVVKSNTPGWYWLIRTDGGARPLPPGAGTWGSANTAVTYSDANLAHYTPGIDRTGRDWRGATYGPFRRIAMSGPPPVPYAP